MSSLSLILPIAYLVEPASSNNSRDSFPSVSAHSSMNTLLQSAAQQPMAEVACAACQAGVPQCRQFRGETIGHLPSFSRQCIPPTHRYFSRGREHSL
ncbi:hypothetical protein B0H13DRAFT_2050531 [Mycena leptocephala]|nr:hypothetical protein B0H13DRAFT_2050531 [Mycena leptocephala]